MRKGIPRRAALLALLLSLAWPVPVLAQAVLTPPPVQEIGNPAAPTALPADGSSAFPATLGAARATGPETATPHAPDGMALNPFAYNLPSDSKGFIPAMEGDIPAGIEVQGIICINGSRSLAALQVPGYKEPFYVTEDDVIALRTAKGAGKEGPVYIQVGKIGAQEVELYPRTNPSNIHILR